MQRPAEPRPAVPQQDDRLNAMVPLAELYRYSTTLSSLTSGSATYTMKFSSYEQVPADVQDKLLKAYTDTDDE